MRTAITPLVYLARITTATPALLLGTASHAAIHPTASSISLPKGVCPRMDSTTIPLINWLFLAPLSVLLALALVITLAPAALPAKYWSTALANSARQRQV